VALSPRRATLVRIAGGTYEPVAFASSYSVGYHGFETTYQLMRDLLLYLGHQDEGALGRNDPARRHGMTRSARPARTLDRNIAIAD
jgi:hypothetical protein